MTIKQKQAIKNTVENGGNITQGMRDAKYKETTINNPKNLTKSKAWNELLGKYLPDEELLSVTKEGMKANKIITSHTEPDYEYPDHAIRLKSAEQGYRLKGKYIESEGNTTNILVIPSELIEKYEILKSDDTSHRAKDSS